MCTNFICVRKKISSRRVLKGARSAHHSPVGVEVLLEGAMLLEVLQRLGGVARLAASVDVVAVVGVQRTVHQLLL